MGLDTATRTGIQGIITDMDRAGFFAGAGSGPLPEVRSIAPYQRSFRLHRGGALFLVRTSETKLLLAVDLALPLQGESLTTPGRQVTACPLSAENAAVMREELPFAAPAKLVPHRPSVGCGDRIGLANPGHVRLLRGFRVSPVLAQQSIRELTLTGRTFGQVIDAATWAVLQEGYEEGFGADGDHLKTVEEVRMVLGAGASMVTLDLSLCLGVAEGRGPCPGELLAQAGQVFSSRGVEIRLEAEEIERFWATYWAALEFVKQADEICRAHRGNGRYDLEVSVDETAHTTCPVDHLLLAAELKRRGITPFSVAPRFPGEFQKAIDYRGELAEFEREFRVHAAIAASFGYKVSVHSGSDKFSIFPVVAKLAEGNFHEKTAGTSWLEAVRVVARKNPGLFRRIYGQAKGFFPEAKKYYHIMTELADVPEIADWPDPRLPELLDEDASRQFLHITYGQIMQAPDLGPHLLRSIHIEEEAYYEALGRHFLRHLKGLGIGAQ